MIDTFFFTLFKICADRMFGNGVGWEKKGRREAKVSVSHSQHFVNIAVIIFASVSLYCVSQGKGTESTLVE